MEICYQQLYNSPNSPLISDVYVKYNFDLNCYGLYASRDLNKGTLWEYKGVLFDPTKVIVSSNTYVMCIADDLCVDGNPAFDVNGDYAMSFLNEPVCKKVELNTEFKILLKNVVTTKSLRVQAQIMAKTNKTSNNYRAYVQVTKKVLKDEQLCICYGKYYVRNYPHLKCCHKN